MAKFNLKKEKTLLHEKQLEKERKSQKLEAPEDLITNKLLEEKRKNNDGNVLTESLLKDTREEPVGHSVTEAAIEDHSVTKDLPKRTGKDNHDVLPINALEAVNDRKVNEAYNNARETEKPLVDNVGSAPAKPQSQLHNDPERFKDLSVEDVKNNVEVRKMITASLADADAMLYFIYRKALSEKRELSKEEEELISGISSDKAKILEIIFNKG